MRRGGELQWVTSQEPQRCIRPPWLWRSSQLRVQCQCLQFPEDRTGSGNVGGRLPVTDTIETLLQAVEAIRPILLTDAETAEAKRAPTATAYQAMYDAGLFAMLAPRRYGGLEL